MARPTPLCNHSFIIEALLENKRIDNRTLYQFRDLQVNYGQTFGSCFVQLGNTIIFASTEATIEEPRIARPSEGRFRLIFNIGAGGKEKWRNIERTNPIEAVLATMLLEKVMNRINVIDLDALCLITGKAVWSIITKLVLLNYDGNLMEAASIATIASLMHFKRPDATVTAEGDIIIHSSEERNPIPLTLFHYPIFVTFQFMDPTHIKKILSENLEIDSEQHKNRFRKATQLMICDPNEEEEEILHNVLMVCVNAYREVVAIESVGQLSLASLSKQLLQLCTKKAFERVKYVTDYLKTCLESHSKSTTTNIYQRYGFHEALKNGDLCIIRNFDRHPVLGLPREDPSNLLNKDEDNIGLGGTSKWNVTSTEYFNDEDNVEDNDNNNKHARDQLKNKWIGEISEPEQELKSYSQVIGKPKEEKSLKTNVPKSNQFVVKQASSNQKKPMNERNKWTVVDKKKAATKTELKSTVQKFNEKMSKNKKMYVDDNDSDEEIVQLKWEYSSQKKK